MKVTHWSPDLSGRLTLSKCGLPDHGKQLLLLMAQAEAGKSQVQGIPG